MGPILASFYLSLTDYEVVRAPVFAGLIGPWAAATGTIAQERRREGPEVRRAR